MSCWGLGPRGYKAAPYPGNQASIACTGIMGGRADPVRRALAPTGFSCRILYMVGFVGVAGVVEGFYVLGTPCQYYVRGSSGTRVLLS